MNDGMSNPFRGADARNAAEARAQVVLGNRILVNEGLLDGYGHVTVRNPENPSTFFMSASISPELVTLETILELDLDGQVLTETERLPYAERFLHVEVFRARPDVQSISHFHAMPVIVLSIADEPIRCVFHMAGVFYEGVPYYDSYDTENGTLAMTREEGERIAACLGGRRGCVMRGHGAVVVGESVAHCMMASIALRDNCLVQMQAMSVSGGKIWTYPEALARAAAQKNLSVNPLARGWNYWLARAKKAMPDIAGL